MLPSLLVAAAITAPAAPIPKDTVPNASGPAPRIVAVKADSSGSVWIAAQVWEKRKVQQQFFANENGKQVLKQQEVEQNFPNYIHKSIGDFGGKFTTAEGTAISTEDATKRVKNGATLLVTADGKPIDKGWLRAVGNDTVIMIAEGLAHAHFQYNQYNQANSYLPTTAAPRLTMLCADDKNEVKLAVNPSGGNNNGQQIYYDDLGGGRIVRGGRAIMIQNEIAWEGGGYAPPQVPVMGDGKKPLSEVKFDAFDMSGKLVPRNEALKRLKAGGMVLLSGDNRFPDEGYLKAFREDMLVLVSGDFVFPQGQPNPYDMPVKPPAKADADSGKPAPPANAVQPAIGAIAPAIQLKAAPLIIKQVAPAVDLPAPKAEVKPAAKVEEKPDAKKPEAKPAEKPVKRN